MPRGRRLKTLTESDRNTALERYARGEGYCVIARDIGVSSGTIRRLLISCDVAIRRPDFQTYSRARGNVLSPAFIFDRSIPEPMSGCWLWMRGRGLEGYGLVSVRGLSNRAHRVSWEIFRGPIPEGMYVCHRCDNPCCVNPRHLFVGTPTDNVLDKISKGRSRNAPQRNPALSALRRSGTKSGHAQLSEPKVLEMRRLREQGWTYPALAEKYGVAINTAWFAVKGVTWKHTAKMSAVEAKQFSTAVI